MGLTSNPLQILRHVFDGIFDLGAVVSGTLKPVQEVPSVDYELAPTSVARDQGER
jgi:hypothetical protein